MLNITKDDEGYFWLHIHGRAMLNLGKDHGPIVTEVLDDAVVADPNKCHDCKEKLEHLSGGSEQTSPANETAAS